ncbi:hypothetical protein [Streptodolium elevatio]|uniref:Uncharacterized protein n=1 Tax=Streptodolium elevatio TaxID=3157996 RepID=A0ABV3DTF3_9ACTN
MFLHRSWTRRGIYEATFAPDDGGGWRIVGAVVERDPGRYGNTDDECDRVMLELALGTIVLGESAPEPGERLTELVRRASGSDVSAGAIRLSALGLRSDP